MDKNIFRSTFHSIVMGIQTYSFRALEPEFIILVSRKEAVQDGGNLRLNFRFS
jgi:hypothetical protein